jgi:putative heme-binding domain-containing protein
MDNPVEVDFTDEGDMIGTVNILYSRPRVDALVHWLYGGAYPHRERVLEELKTTGGFLGPIHRFGHVAVSGTTRYRSGVMDHRWGDNFFATFFNSGKVVRLELEKEGSSYSVRQREFLSGTSPDFHPTDVIEDADGSLLVVDTGGWFYRGCPTSQMSKPDVLGGIYRIRRNGMTTQVDPRGSRIDWANQSGRQLIRLLNDTRHVVRERAIAECANRGQAVVPQLASAVRRSDIRVRQNALWALTRIVGDQPESEAAYQAILTGLEDAEASLRQTACRALATYPSTDAVPALIDRLADSDAGVRREAAKALGRAGSGAAVRPLLDRLRGDDLDRSEEHAVLFALIEIDDADQVASGLQDPSPAVRRGCLIALDQMDAGRLKLSQIVASLGTGDLKLQRTAAEILTRVLNSPDPSMDQSWPPKAAEAVAENLERWFVADPQAEWPAKTVATFAAYEPVANRLADLLDADTFGPVQAAALRAIVASGKAPAHDRWRAAVARWLESDDPQAVRAAIDASTYLRDERINSILESIRENGGRSGAVRVAALRVLSRGSSQLSDDGFDALLEMLSGGVAADSDQAAEMLASSRLTVDQLKALADRFPDVGPAALQILIRPYGSRPTPKLADHFLDRIKSARAFEQLPTNEFSDVIKRFPVETLPRANALLARLKQLDQQRIAAIDRLIPMLADADAERGREMFFAEKSKCSTCHRVDKRGGEVGPDLTTIGSNRSQNDLLESILFPSASIVRQYESQTLMTDAGQVYTGIISRETADAVYLQQQTGDPITIPRDQIEQVVPSTVSIMPKGLDANLSEQELADLVAYLMTLGK